MKSIRYFDDCSSDEKYARDWIDTAFTSRTSDNEYYVQAKASGGWKFLVSVDDRISKWSYRLKFKVKYVDGNASRYFAPCLNCASDVRSIYFPLDGASLGKCAFALGSALASSYAPSVGLTIADGAWHEIEIVVWSEGMFSAFIDGAICHDHTSISSLHKGAGDTYVPAKKLALAVYNCDCKFKDIEISDLTTDDYPATDTPLEVVEVGNRKFLCEFLSKMVWGDIDAYPGTGGVISNVGTADDPIFDIYGTNIAISSSYFNRKAADTPAQTLNSCSLWTFEAARMVDDDPNYAIGAYWRPIRDGPSINERNIYQNPTTDVWMLGVIQANTTKSYVWPKDAAYRLVGFGLLNRETFCGFENIDMALHGPDVPSSWSYLILSNYAAANKTYHWRYKNIKLYRIISEVSA